MRERVTDGGHSLLLGAAQPNVALNNLKIEFGSHDAHWRRIIANTLLL